MVFLYLAAYENSFDQELRKYLPLVSKVVNQLGYKRNAGFDQDDFISVGMLGLYEALQTYDSSTNIPFERYARMKIKWKIVDEIRKSNDITYARVQQVISFLKKQEELEQRLMRQPTDVEVATSLEMNAKELSKTKEAINYFLIYSLDQLVDDDQNTNFYDIHACDNHHQENALIKLIKEENRSFLSYAISHLEEREQLLIQFHFVEGLNFNQISEILELSPSRVSQLYRKTLKSLQVFYIHFKRNEER